MKAQFLLRNWAFRLSRNFWQPCFPNLTTRFPRAGIEPPHPLSKPNPSAQLSLRSSIARKPLLPHLHSRCVAKECSQRSFAHSLPAGSLKPAIPVGKIRSNYVRPYLCEVMRSIIEQKVLRADASPNTRILH